MSTTLNENEITTRPLRVLIVDDSEADVVMYRRMLAGSFGEFEAVDSDTGADALEHAARGEFDVALVDYRLPDMDGLEILTRLARLKPRLATILLTGQGSESVAAQAIKRGAHDYLVKRDIDADSLASVITAAIEASAASESADPQLVERLTQSNRELDHAVRSLSHDMNANFMVLENSFQQIKNSCDPASGPRLLHGVSHVEACLRESKRFLDDMVLLTRTGSVAMEPASVEMSIVVQNVLFELEGQLEERAISVDIESPLPRLWCNEHRVTQLVSNLVRNAIKHGCHSSRGRITISSPARASRQLPPGCAWIRIHDNGRGIPAAACEAVFLPGHRLPTAHADGSGMGLAIVKKIIERSGGVIFIDPACQDGTAFVFALPLAGER